ncbi:MULTISPECIES: RICIN domain-containing protein [Nostocales]|uniref:RICIN domain-containing protein n=1 Tax=Nostocales TaxID=1161 RepID=UPI00168512FE|nr:MULTISPECIES: RICIN domain-containing protein [Nostocales]MBD2301378.1 RICIN domain-containing protein [Nostoc sp. FACHB-190]MBD2486734.1 RICIN domain-containing protein [Aulosira sp. FACHB-615]
MVATPVQTSQALSVTYGNDGTKIASGNTTPGATNWQQYSDGIYIEVDTSAAGFTKTPRYITSLAGDSKHYGTTGATSIYNPTATGFRIQIRWEKDYESGTITPELANTNKWHINWIAIEPASAKTPRPAAGKYYYLVVKHTGKVLNVTGGSKEDNIQLIQYDKSDSDNSKWLLEDTGDGSYYLVAKHSGKVANIAGGGSVDGSNAVQYQKGNNDNSKWLLEDAGDGYFYIIGKQSGKVLQVNGGNKENGAKVDQWTRQNVDHHKWKFEAV